MRQLKEDTMILFNNQPIDNGKFSEEILNHGSCIYEVCRVFRGKVIFMDDNLARLANSIKKSGAPIDFSTLRMEDKLNRLIQLEHIKEGNIKYVLRLSDSGVDEYVYQIPHSYPSEEAYKHGVDTATLQAMRPNAEVKYIEADLRKTTNDIIKEKNVYEVLLVDKDGFVTEGSRSNVFFIKDNALHTAPLPYVLPGTSRKRVLALCAEEHISVVEEKVPLCDLPRFDAAFITGTSPLVLPIRRVDNLAFDPCHPLLRRVMEAYFRLLERHM